MTAPVITTDALREARRFVWRAYGYSTHEPAVDRFHDSMARTKIVSCPARTSKSFAAAQDVLPDILLTGVRLREKDPYTRTHRGWIVAPNFDLAKEFDYLWRQLVEVRHKVGLLSYRLGRCKNNPKQGDMEIVLEWGKNASGEDVKSIVTVKSAANEKSLQSEQLDWVILSEAARLESTVWFKYLRTRTGRSIWPTTPDVQASWIWEQIQQAQENPSLGIEHFVFTGRANPDYDWANYWIEHQKAELNIANAIKIRPSSEKKPPSAANGHDCFDDAVGCEAMKEDGFAEQMGGKWVFHRGRVVPLRERVGENGQPAHVIDHDLAWFRHADLHVSLDYGYSDGTVVGFWLVGPKQIVLRKSIYEVGLTPDDIVHRTLSTIRWFEDKYNATKMLRRIVGDPKKPEVSEIFRRRGLPIWDVDKAAQSDRKAGHLELMNYLRTDPRTGEPSLLVHAENVDVIKEWRTLRRNENVRSEDSTTAFKGADHAYDMARYFVMTHPIAPERQTIDKISWFEAQREANVKRAAKTLRESTVRSGMGKSRVGGVYVGAA